MRDSITKLVALSLILIHTQSVIATAGDGTAPTSEIPSKIKNTCKSTGKPDFFPSPQLESVIYYGGQYLLKNKQLGMPALAKKIRHDHPGADLQKFVKALNSCMKAVAKEPWSGEELTYDKLKALSDMLNVNFSKEMGNPKPTYDTDTESTAQKG